MTLVMVLYFLSQSIAHVSVTQQTHHVAIFHCFFSSLRAAPLITQHRAWHEVSSQWVSLPQYGTSFPEARLQQTWHVDNQQAASSVFIAGSPALGSVSGTQYILPKCLQEWMENRSPYVKIIRFLKDHILFLIEWGLRESISKWKTSTSSPKSKLEEVWGITT